MWWMSLSIDRFESEFQNNSLCEAISNIGVKNKYKTIFLKIVILTLIRPMQIVF